MIDQDYYDLRMGGYTEKEVADYFTRILGSGGFSDQEVNAFIVRQKGYYDQLAQEAGVARTGTDPGGRARILGRRRKRIFPFHQRAAHAGGRLRGI